MAENTFFGRTDEGHFLEIQWDVSWSAVTTRSSGETGWGRILRSSGGDVPEGACRRIHKCGTNPCTARWPVSIYGMLGPPIHVQEVSPSEVSFGPGPPQSAPLHKGHAPPAAKLDPQWRMTLKSARESALADGSQREQELFTLIVRLAREIRTPRSYVGYSFLVLLALARKCRPIMWEGSQRIDLLQSFVPWANESAVADCAVQGVVCCMKAQPNGAAEMVPVSEEHPLDQCRHFVACHQLENALECAGDSIESFYGRLGIVLLGTVVDGDCGLDTACMMLGLPQTFENRVALRQEISTYLLDRHDAPWMHQLLVVCSEIPLEVVERAIPQWRWPLHLH